MEYMILCTVEQWAAKQAKDKSNGADYRAALLALVNAVAAVRRRL